MTNIDNLRPYQRWAVRSALAKMRQSEAVDRALSVMQGVGMITMPNDCPLCENVGEYFCPRHGEHGPLTETRIREIVREEVELALRGRDTIPAPSGDSHSGAIVVPRGSSNRPLFKDGSGCLSCGMLACVCALPPTDGSNGEGGP